MNTLKVNENIESYNSTIAFGILLINNPELQYNSFIDITDIVGDKSIEPYKGLGLLFCKRLCGLGTNENKIQYSIHDNITPGTKDFETFYVLVPHYKNSGKALVIQGQTTFKMKKDAETAAKIYCSQNAVDVHIKTVKVMMNADPFSTEIRYKPSPKQSLSTFLFFD
jgi:hypothetical protein